MRRLLTLLLLTLLALPFSAVAMADGFGHPVVGQALPPSHHAPHHLLAPEGTGSQAEVASGIDMDCSTCHVSCAAALPASALHAIACTGMAFFQFSARQVFSLWHERPYRPKWSAPMGSGWPISA